MLPRPRTPGAALVLAFAGMLGACNNGGGGGSSASHTPGPPPKVVTMDEGLPDPVARVAGQDITLAQLETEAAAGIVRARQQMYDARKQALDKMIDDQLMEAEARKRGVSKDELVKKEVEDKIEKVDESKAEDFYQENKERMRQPFEQMKERIMRHLERQTRQEREQAFREELRKAAAVEVFIAPPKYDASPDDDERKGPADAPVQIIEFSDYQCPYCSKAEDTVDKVLEKYGDKVSVVYRDFPLPMHKEAHKASQAAECAGEQGKFWDYHKLLFKNQQKLQEPELQNYAQQVGLDSDKFKKCLESGQMAAEVDKDIADGKALGMSGTPGFYINGRNLSGARPFEAFVEIIDQELAAK